jgi:hypothetical protein
LVLCTINATPVGAVRENSPAITPLVPLGTLSPFNGGAKFVTHPLKGKTKLTKARYLIQRISSPLFEKLIIGPLKEGSRCLVENEIRQSRVHLPTNASSQ